MDHLENSSFVLPTLSAWKKKQYLRCATRVLEAQQKMQTADGKNILHYTLNGETRHLSMSHYPDDDRIDTNTGGQYYYHCHRENYETEEQGHFHCFFRYQQIPKRIKPTPLSDWDKFIKNPMTHLVGISMNTLGQPIRLFAVNRWVTSEIWYGAHHTPYFIRNFKMSKQDNPYWQVLDQWIEGMLHLFLPQISWLNHQRDRTLLDYQAKNMETSPYDCESLEEIAEIKINVSEQIQWIIS
jgi:hypothetical protein